VRGSVVQLQTFLTSALDGGEWLASRLDRFTPGETIPGANWLGGWGGPQSLLDAVAKIKSPCSCWKSNQGLPASSLVTILTELPGYRLPAGNELSIDITEHF